MKCKLRKMCRHFLIIFCRAVYTNCACLPKDFCARLKITNVFLFSLFFCFSHELRMQTIKSCLYWRHPNVKISDLPSPFCHTKLYDLYRTSYRAAQKYKPLMTLLARCDLLTVPHLLRLEAYTSFCCIAQLPCYGKYYLRNRFKHPPYFNWTIALNTLYFRVL